MALDLAALRTEIRDRGFDYLSDSRINRFVNDAMHAIDDLEDWPYLNATTTGTAPLTISDLAKIESVSDPSGYVSLRQRARGEMIDTYASLTQTGVSGEFYVTGGNTINTYPVNTSTTLTVNYWKVAPDLVNDTDTPLMPDRFRYAIVEYAVATALRDDESGAAQQAQLAGDMIVDRMRVWAGTLEPSVSVINAYGDDC